MEVARNSSKVIYLDIYGDTADVEPTATITINGVTNTLPVDSETPPAGVTARYYTTVNMAHTQSDGIILVEWTFSIDGTEAKKKDYLEVFTPYLTIGELKEINPAFTTAEAQRAEAATRHVINAHTGQDFGLYVGIKKVRGTGDSAVQLPARLIEFDDVPNVNGTFVVSNNGWVLKGLPWGVPPVKADYYGLHMHVGGVIHNPNMVKLNDWTDGWEYDVSGTWGWEFVPQPVKEAARLLVEDYSDPDSEYRDRYLTSMTAADWRIQFHSGAFRKTGNVRADQLLAKYVLKSGWAVV